MGVGGAFEVSWIYCPDHRMRAKAERDAYLVKKGLPVFDRTKSHEEYFEEHCEPNGTGDK